MRCVRDARIAPGAPFLTDGGNVRAPPARPPLHVSPGADRRDDVRTDSDAVTATAEAPVCCALDARPCVETS